MGGLFAKTFHLCIGVILGFSVARVQATPLDEAIELRHRGEFQKAVQVLNTYLDATSSSLPAEERRAVEF
ncbi:MAG: hypothetical protein ACP5QZ_07275, partial [Candidatus Sumerlaeaceae bacterium]